jgi:uncharacterized membrane protein (DUF373 family)
MLLNKFEKIVSYILMVCVMCYIAFQTIELVWESIKGYTARIRAAGLDYTTEYGRSIFIIFFNILLALEILETVRVFDKDHDIKIRIILLVCIIAISRKILTLDTIGSNPVAEFALAALIIGLSGGYYLVNRSRRYQDNKAVPGESKN